MPGEPLGDLHALHHHREQGALLGDQARLPGDPVVEARYDHPRLRRRLQDRLLRPAQVAAEVPADFVLPLPHGNGDCAAAVEALGRERRDGAAQASQAMRRLPAGTGTPATVLRAGIHRHLGVRLDGFAGTVPALAQVTVHFSCTF